MVQRITPRTKVVVVPKDGEIEITLNINITIDGELGIQSHNIEAKALVAQPKNSVDDTAPLIPNFSSGGGLSFGKKI